MLVDIPMRLLVDAVHDLVYDDLVPVVYRTDMSPRIVSVDVENIQVDTDADLDDPHSVQVSTTATIANEAVLQVPRLLAGQSRIYDVAGVQRYVVGAVSGVIMSIGRYTGEGTDDPNIGLIVKLDV